MKKVAIVIPAYYRSKFSLGDLISLKQLRRYLDKYDKYFIIPDNTDLKKVDTNNFQTIKFPRNCFKSTKTYNKLLLSENFYNKFKNYNYILIYQLDALVFSDQLDQWCNRSFDYISAPWYFPVVGYLSHKKGSPFSGGNGGFSLRNVQSCLKVFKIANKQITRNTNSSLTQKLWFIKAVLTGNSHNIWLRAPINNYPFNEDGFWSLEAPKYLTDYKVAPFKTALKFSFETFPTICYLLNSKHLPFGCHAWEKYNNNFWRKFI